MAFKVCTACGRQNSPNARWCVSCKTPFEQTGDAAGAPFAAPLDARGAGYREPVASPGDERAVGIGLGLGIFLLPYIFAWLTLRRGHSMLARVVAFGWMVAVLIVAVQGNASRSEQDNATAAAAVVQGEAAWAKGIREGCVKTNRSSMGAYTDKVCQCTVDRVMTDFSRQELAEWAEHVEKYGVGPMTSKEKYKGILYQCVFTHHPKGNEFFVEDGKR
jgi:hypothetical protein